jgi:DNA repair and recombination protein RAD54B
MQKRKAGLAALGEWGHINCLQASAQDSIQDDVLQKLIIACKPTANDTSHQALTQLDQLLAVDLENIGADDDALTVKEVPGGSVSFLFQKNSSALELQSKITG